MKQGRLFPKGPPDGDGELPAPPPSREQLRSRRRWPTRARTASMTRLPKGVLAREREQLELLEAADPIGHVERPVTRADCKDGARPCPFVSCKHHLYLDVSPKTGAIKFNRPELAPEDMVESCSLDVADRGGTTLEEVGSIMNLTRERIRQIEIKGLNRLEADPRVEHLREAFGLERAVKPTRRHLKVVPEQAAAADFDAEAFASAELDD
jgi:hypothetical protein